MSGHAWGATVFKRGNVCYSSRPAPMEGLRGTCRALACVKEDGDEELNERLEQHREERQAQQVGAA
jgi:hypothetical protein